MSPTSPLIILDEAGQHQAVAHRDPSLDIREVRHGRVRGRTHSRSRRRSRYYASSRRRHRRRRDSSESSDSDFDYDYRSGTPRRATDGVGTPRYTNRQHTTPAEQPPVRYVQYNGRVTTPAGSRPASATNQSQEHIYGVSDGQECYISSGWTAEVTSSQPALETGLRTALVTRPLTSEEPIYTYVALPTSAGPPRSEGIFRQPASAGLSASAGTFASAGTSAGAGLFRHSYSAGTTYGPAQHYQPVTVHQHDSPSIYPSQHLPTSTSRRHDLSQGGASPPGGRPLPVSTVTSTNDANPPTTEAATVVDMTPKRPTANVEVKLGTYDGNSCLETFLASLRNFATYFKWSEEDELFHLSSI